MQATSRAFSPRVREDRKKDSGENRDYGYDNEQFNQRKGAAGHDGFSFFTARHNTKRTERNSLIHSAGPPALPESR
jgi:hypothetical protein